MATQHKVTAAVQAKLAEAVSGTAVTLAEATKAYRAAGMAGVAKLADNTGTPIAPANANPTKATTKAKVATLTPANAKAAKAVAEQADKAKADNAAAKVARVPRTTAAEKLLRAAEAGGWAVAEHAEGSEVWAALRMLNPHRGKRNWVAVCTRGTGAKAEVFTLSTLLGYTKGGVHADRCTFEAAGQAELVEMVYEQVATLLAPVGTGALHTKAARDFLAERETAKANA